MKFSAQEEYGLRCLIQIGKINSDSGVTISEISAAEGLTTHNVAKLLRILRKSGFLHSIRGHTGGYVLADLPDNINIGKVLAALGGRLYDSSFCNKHKGADNICTHSVDCTMRSIWTSLQNAIDEILGNLTLGDLLKKNEHDLSGHLHEISESILSQHQS